MFAIEDIKYKQRIDIADSDLAKISLVCCEDMLDGAFETLKLFPHIDVERICYLPFLPFIFCSKEYKGIPVEKIRDLNPDVIYVTLTCGTSAFNTVSNVLGFDVNKVKFFYL